MCNKDPYGNVTMDESDDKDVDDSDDLYLKSWLVKIMNGPS